MGAASCSRPPVPYFDNAAPRQERPEAKPPNTSFSATPTGTFTSPYFKVTLRPDIFAGRFEHALGPSARSKAYKEHKPTGRIANSPHPAISLAVCLHNSFLALMLRLTLLMPDIVEAILDATEPEWISLEKLYRLAVEREGQRCALDVTATRPFPFRGAGGRMHG